MLQTFNFRVEMPCNSCAGHVRKLLQSQMEKGSVVSYTVDPIEKLVRITTNLNLDEIQTELKKCGKPVTFLSSVNASIFNPEAFKPAKLPPKQNQNGLQRPSTQPQVFIPINKTPTTTYTAPSSPPPGVRLANWSPNNSLQQPGGLAEAKGQIQGGPQPYHSIVRQRLSGLPPATITSITTDTASAAAAAKLLSGPPQPEPTFKVFPANPQQNAPAPGSATTHWIAAPAQQKENTEKTSSKPARKVTSSLSRRRRSRSRRSTQAQHFAMKKSAPHDAKENEPEPKPGA